MKSVDLFNQRSRSLGQNWFPLSYISLNSTRELSNGMPHICDINILYLKNKKSDFLKVDL